MSPEADRLEVERLEPAAFGAAQAELRAAGDALALALAPLDAALLSPSHPFLAFGRWRGFVAGRRGRPAARLVASVDARQTEGGAAVGAIGFVGVANEGFDTDDGIEVSEALAAALAAAQRWLHEAGARVVRCPVRLSTWFGHRTITHGAPGEGGGAGFFMEPADAPRLREALRAGGYRPAHRAVSLEVENECVLARGKRHLERLRSAGYRDRALDRGRLVEELALLHRLASAVFRDNWGFGEVSAAEFAAFYAPLAARVDPELVRFVERGGEPAGFVFAAADGAAAQERFVFKTIGVRPDARERSPGIGAALVALAHQVAAQRGYRRGVHALMTEGSVAHRTSAHWGTWLRSYATFERTLD